MCNATTVLCAPIANSSPLLLLQKDTKPKAWAFQLWRASQPHSGATNVWRFYLDWAKLDESQQEAWIVAGRTLQTFTRMGQATLQEVQMQVTRPVVGGPDAVKGVASATPATIPVNVIRQTRRGVLGIKKENVNID